MRELGRGHALVPAQLEREVVVKAHGPGETVAHLHEVQEAVGQDPALDLAEGVEGAAAALFYRVVGLVGGQHAERGHLRLAVLVDVAKLQRALLGKQRGLVVDDCAHEGATLIIVDAVGLEQRPPTVQATHQCITLVASRRVYQPREMVAGGVQLRRVGNERFVGVLRPGKARLVVARGHIGGPEQIFFGLMDRGIGVVQLVEIRAGTFHGDTLSDSLAVSIACMSSTAFVRSWMTASLPYCSNVNSALTATACAFIADGWMVQSAVMLRRNLVEARRQRQPLWLRRHDHHRRLVLAVQAAGVGHPQGERQHGIVGEPGRRRKGRQRRRRQRHRGATGLRPRVLQPGKQTLWLQTYHPTNYGKFNPQRKKCWPLYVEAVKQFVAKPTLPAVKLRTPAGHVLLVGLRRSFAAPLAP